ncbi:EthD family reductase [Pseudonocardia sp. WMMC193]|uniref:EthD family reductase n=1 Tax=Pseudonocardia sp. WMMC193 TaxID=2911965 RepID=UPI001F0200DB|nr:EthD family reductase [Pseudonocardia sp. WMMC193]MCF7550668.1 EthD family reductase [Pseudonocardia sp. WMMC193]
MHKLVVLYPPPTDREAFRTHYENTHLPLAAALPGLRCSRYAYDVQAAGPDGSPYFAIFEAEFDSAEAMGAALQSPEGAAVAADVPNYATGGAHIVHYAPTAAAGPDPRQVMLDYLAAWSRQDVHSIVAMMAPEGTYQDPSLQAPVSGDHLAKYLEGLFAAVPDLSLTVLGAAADGPDTAVAYWRMTGTATGPGAQSNGGRFDMPGGDILRIDAQGRIVWTEALYDQQTFVSQGGFA